MASCAAIQVASEKTLKAHLDEFRGFLASKFEVSPDDLSLAAFIDRIRGMGLGLLPSRTPPRPPPIRALAAEHGLTRSMDR